MMACGGLNVGAKDMIPTRMKEKKGSERILNTSHLAIVHRSCY